MNIAKAYTKGFIQTAKYPRMLLILYFANILMALLLALPFFSALKSNAGHSDFLNSMLQGFDYTTYSELMFNSGKAFSAILGGVKWIVLTYFLLSAFLTGGIIRTLNEDKFSTSSFFGAGAFSFFRFLGLSLIVALFQIIFLLLVFVPAGAYIRYHFVDFQSELTAYYIGFSALGIYTIIFLIISMIGDYGKFYLELNNSFNIFKAFWKGIKYVFRHFLKTFILYLILLIIPAIIMYVYLYLENDIKMATSIGILLVFLMQQAFILLRVFLRTWILSSELMIYDDDFLQLAEVETVVQSIVEQKVKEIEDKKEIFSESVKTGKEKKLPEIVNETSDEKKEEQSDYQIDFDKTFAKPELVDDKVLSEEEILEKMNEIHSPGHSEEIETEDKKDTKENKDDLIEFDE